MVSVLRHNTIRARTQVTLPKSASAHRECETPLRVSLLRPLILCLCVALRAQNLNLVLDTGSSDLWFATTGCTGCNGSTPVLDPTKSSSFQLGTQRISLNYGSGSAAGVLARDTVSMGPFTVNPQVFGVFFLSPHFRFYSLLLARVIMPSAEVCYDRVAADAQFQTSAPRQGAPGDPMMGH
jgi:hypothetical protein